MRRVGASGRRLGAAWPSKRTVGLIACLPAAVLIGYALGLGRQELPQHAGWFIAAALVVVGALVGLRATLLVVAACITWFVVGTQHGQCASECAVAALVLAYMLVGFSVPVAVGAATAGLWRRFRRRS